MMRILIILTVFTFCFGCTFDKLDLQAPSACDETPTYATNIKPILDKSCAYSGCHVAGFSNGNYASYDAMQANLRSGLFASRVLNQRNMPPAYASGPKELTSEEIELLQCWSENDFPEQ